MAQEEVKVACEICRKEIPRSAAIHAEGLEYILHFCGLPCYKEWKKDSDKKPKEFLPSD